MLQGRGTGGRCHGWRKTEGENKIPELGVREVQGMVQTQLCKQPSFLIPTGQTPPLGGLGPQLSNANRGSQGTLSPRISMVHSSRTLILFQDQGEG